ncbi:MAG: BolA family protein [Mariprofundaceae bacterium]|nr:BolA family protein [Mariprofundaceae bacterium]
MANDISPDHLRELVLAKIPDAAVEVKLFSGDDHFEMEVVSSSFSGKSRIAQHQMVYAAMGEHMREAIHALTLKTRAK